MPVCRVGHDTQSGKGQMMCSGGLGGNMRFRIDGEGTRFEMQGAPFGRAGHGKIDTGDVGDYRTAERAGKPLRPNRIATIACAVFGDDRTGDELCPWNEPPRQAARDAKTDDSRNLAREDGFQSPRETRDVAAARHGADPWAGGNSCFRLEASNGNDRRRVYIPMRTGCGLPALRLR